LSIYFKQYIFIFLNTNIRGSNLLFCPGLAKPQDQACLQHLILVGKVSVLFGYNQKHMGGNHNNVLDKKNLRNMHETKPTINKCMQTTNEIHVKYTMKCNASFKLRFSF